MTKAPAGGRGLLCPRADADRRAMRRLLGLPVLVSFCSLTLASAASAELMLHVRGSKARMKDQTGQRSNGEIAFWDWKQGWTYGLRFHNAFPDKGPPSLAMAP